jgi:adenine-specific DNA-methyltransferase
MARARRPSGPKDVEALRQNHATRRNIPTAEFQSTMRDEDKSPDARAHERRNRDLDPQLVWRGKDEQDWSDLVVHAPPLHIREKFHAETLIDDLARETEARRTVEPGRTPDLFADFKMSRAGRRPRPPPAATT